MELVALAWRSERSRCTAGVVAQSIKFEKQVSNCTLSSRWDAEPYTGPIRFLTLVNQGKGRSSKRTEPLH